MNKKNRLGTLKSTLKYIFGGGLYFKGGHNPYSPPKRPKTPPPAPSPAMQEKMKNKE